MRRADRGQHRRAAGACDAATVLIAHQREALRRLAQQWRNLSGYDAIIQVTSSPGLHVGNISGVTLAYNRSFRTTGTAVVTGCMFAIASTTIAAAATIEEVAHCRAIPQLTERLNCFKSLKPGPRAKTQAAAPAMKQHAGVPKVKDDSRANAKQTAPAKTPAKAEQAAPTKTAAEPPKTDEAAPPKKARLHRLRRRRQLSRMQVRVYPRRKMILPPPRPLIVSVLHTSNRCVRVAIISSRRSLPGCSLQTHRRRSLPAVKHFPTTRNSNF